jgi:pimeloyl-ACP methyl ester carboxylesterase
MTTAMTIAMTTGMAKTAAREGVDALERFDFGGPAQWALVRGRSRTSPVLLMVQAGPGFPIIQDAASIEARLHLEENFRVVYWDQRGTGKSFDSKAKDPITVQTQVADIRAMVRALCERLVVSHIDVVSFSLGGSLSLLACADPSLPVRSLTCVGPDVNLLENDGFALAFALKEAERRGHKGALRALRAIGEPPHVDTKRFMTRVKWVSNFGGVHRGKDFGAMLRDTIRHLWSSPHYSLREMVGALRGMGATQASLLPALRGFDLLATPLRVRVPTAVFQGRLDRVTVPERAPVLAEHVGAEGVVWFEDSAHTPHEEEPQRFREELLRFINSVGHR